MFAAGHPETAFAFLDSHIHSFLFARFYFFLLAFDIFNIHSHSSRHQFFAIHFSLGAFYSCLREGRQLQYSFHDGREELPPYVAQTIMVYVCQTYMNILPTLLFTFLISVTPVCLDIIGTSRCETILKLRSCQLLAKK